MVAIAVDLSHFGLQRPIAKDRRLHRSVLRQQPIFSRISPSNTRHNSCRPRNVVVYANYSPNNDNERSNIDIPLPLLAVAGVAGLAIIVGPMAGGFTAVLGLPLIITGVFAALGYLDSIATSLGITPVMAASLVAGSTVGILLIPTFLKFGFFLIAGYFIFNLLFGEKGPLYKEPEIDARNAIIDVSADTIDDNNS